MCEKQHACRRHTLSLLSSKSGKQTSAETRYCQNSLVACVRQRFGRSQIEARTLSDRSRIWEASERKKSRRLIRKWNFLSSILSLALNARRTEADRKRRERNVCASMDGIMLIAIDFNVWAFTTNTNIKCSTQIASKRFFCGERKGNRGRKESTTWSYDFFPSFASRFYYLLGIFGNWLFRSRRSPIFARKEAFHQASASIAFLPYSIRTRAISLRRFSIMTPLRSSESRIQQN